MEYASVKDSEVPLKQTMTAGDQSCSNLNTAKFMFTADDSTSVIAEASLDTKTKTLNVTLKNWNAVFISQVEQIQPMEAEADSIVQCFSSPGVSEEESQQKPNTSSGEILVDVEPSLPVIRKQGFLNGPQCEEILKNLELLQDSGKFEQHKRFFNFFLQRSVEKGNKDMKVITNEHQIPNGEHCNQVLKKFQGNGQLKKDEHLFSLYSRLCTQKEFADMELALIIEQGVSFMYHKQLGRSKRYFTSVIELAEHCQLRNPNILIARAYLLLAANYNSRARKTKNVSDIMECLRRSEDLLQNHDSPEDVAEMYFTSGIVWLSYMSYRIPDDERNSKARMEIRERAKTYYERAIAICKKDPRSRVQLKRLTYCHLGLAALLLDCSSPVARTRIKVIPSQDLKDARKHLDIIEHQLGDIPPGTRVQILKKRSDQYYRQGPEMYQLAKETAQDALQMARSHEFNTELESLQERLDFLDQLCENTVCSERIKLLVYGDSSTSDSESGFEASCSETDENPGENGLSARRPAHCSGTKPAITHSEVPKI